MAADLCYSAAFGRAAVQRYILANDVVITNLQPGVFSVVGEVSRFGTDGAEGKKAVVRADFCWPMDDHVGYQLAILSQFHARADDTIRSHGAGRVHLGFGIYDC